MSAVPSENLEIHESASFIEEAEDGTQLFDEKGRIPIHIIRPGIGKGKGRHLYEANMLQEHAGVFKGWRMFVDHLSPAAKKALGGLPRPLQHSGGIVKESYWDPTVPADPERGYGPGAVVGIVKPRRWIRELIEDDPALAEASISAQATSVRPVVRDGQRAWLVEGIAPKGSVDWVTEAGAGGRVAALMEAAAEDEEEVHMALLEGLTDDDVREYLRDHPELVEEAKKKDTDEPGDAAEDAADGGKDEALEDKIKSHMKKGLPRAMAEKAARKEMTEAAEEDTMAITKETLQEALGENPDVLVGVLQESEALQGYLDALVEAKAEEKSEVSKAHAKATVDRAFELARLERTAHEVIAESKLPDSWQENLRKRYALEESGPTESLNVFAEREEDSGEITKSAEAVLREALEADIKDERLRLAEASPTRVRGQGPSKPEEGSGDGKVDPKETGWGRFLQETAKVDPAKAYSIVGAGEDA